MSQLSRVYPYDKIIMLNVLYDTLDTIGFQIEKANSERGTVIARSDTKPNTRVRIACNGVSPESKDKTLIKIFPEPENDFGKRLAEAVLEEISATVKRTLGHQDVH